MYICISIHVYTSNVIYFIFYEIIGRHFVYIHMHIFAHKLNHDTTAAVVASHNRIAVAICWVLKIRNSLDELSGH